MFKQKRLLFGPIAGFVLAVMLAGSVLAPASFAAAEKENDSDKDDKNNKCSQHKYDGKCDNQKPHVNIMWPHCGVRMPILARTRETTSLPRSALWIGPQ